MGGYEEFKIQFPHQFYVVIFVAQKKDKFVFNVLHFDT